MRLLALPVGLFLATNPSSAWSVSLRLDPLISGHPGEDAPVTSAAHAPRLLVKGRTGGYPFSAPYRLVCPLLARRELRRLPEARDREPVAGSDGARVVDPGEIRGRIVQNDVVVASRRGQPQPAVDRCVGRPRRPAPGGRGNRKRRIALGRASQEEPGHDGARVRAGCPVRVEELDVERRSYRVRDIEHDRIVVRTDVAVTTQQRTDQLDLDRQRDDYLSNPGSGKYVQVGRSAGILDDRLDIVQARVVRGRVAHVRERRGVARA